MTKPTNPAAARSASRHHAGVALVQHPDRFGSTRPIARPWRFGIGRGARDRLGGVRGSCEADPGKLASGWVKKTAKPAVAISNQWLGVSAVEPDKFAVPKVMDISPVNHAIHEQNLKVWINIDVPALALIVKVDAFDAFDIGHCKSPWIEFGSRSSLHLADHLSGSVGAQCVDQIAMLESADAALTSASCHREHKRLYHHGKTTARLLDHKAAINSVAGAECVDALTLRSEINLGDLTISRSGIGDGLSFSLRCGDQAASHPRHYCEDFAGLGVNCGEVSHHLSPADATLLYGNCGMVKDKMQRALLLASLAGFYSFALMLPWN